VRFEDFARALDISPTVLEQLESRDALPWNIQPSLIADIAEGLRLHIAAVEALAKNSLVIATVTHKVSDPYTVEKIIDPWLQAVKTEFDRRGAHDLLR
jgi:hypothetical protein